MVDYTYLKQIKEALKDGEPHSQKEIATGRFSPCHHFRLPQR